MFLSLAKSSNRVNIKFIDRILVDLILVSRQALFKVNTISSAIYEV